MSNRIKSRVSNLDSAHEEQRRALPRYPCSWRTAPAFSVDTPSQSSRYQFVYQQNKPSGCPLCQLAVSLLDQPIIALSVANPKVVASVFASGRLWRRCASLGSNVKLCEMRVFLAVRRDLRSLACQSYPSQTGCKSPKALITLSNCRERCEICG